MKDLIACDAATIEALQVRLRQATTIAEFQRIQCVLLRATLACSASRIAQVLGWAKQGRALFALKGKFIVMVMDRAGWHVAGGLVVPDNMRVVYLPPYSPELNPAEQLWESLRERHFANTVCDNLDAVEATLVAGLRSMEVDPLQRRSRPAPTGSLLYH